MSAVEHINDLRIQIDGVVQGYLTEIKPKKEIWGLIQLHRAMGYSLTSGGSRYRPLLALLVAETLSSPVDLVLDFALALELVHTYSLIHDDLPAMDNDDFRRGEPANHKKFGESLAILAGDALCTEPYRVIAEKYQARPKMALQLIRTLSQASGPFGMVGGQAMDVCFKEEKPTEEAVEILHKYKTVALFRAAARGAAVICRASREQKRLLDEYAQALGLIFQITDDIKDGSSMHKEEPSFVQIVGLEKARKYCQNLKASALEKAKSLPQESPLLQTFLGQVFERAR